MLERSVVIPANRNQVAQACIAQSPNVARRVVWDTNLSNTVDARRRWGEYCLETSAYDRTTSTALRGRSTPRNRNYLSCQSLPCLSRGKGLVGVSDTVLMPRTLKVFGVLDVDFLVQLKCLQVVSHPAEAARNHQTPLHLGEQTDGAQRLQR